MKFFVIQDYDGSFVVKERLWRPDPAMCDALIVKTYKRKTAALKYCEKLNTKHLKGRANDE